MTSTRATPDAGGLVAPNRGTVELFFREIRRSYEESGELSLEYTISLLAMLDGAAVLQMEKSRRAARLLGIRPLSKSEQTQLAASARSWGSALQNEVAIILPPDTRRLVYNTASSPEQEVGGTKPPPPSPTNAQLGEPISAIAESGTEEHPIGATVLLLGSGEEHEGNLSLLQNNGIFVLRAHRAADFADLCTASVCAIIVGSSWWGSLTQEEQETSLRAIISYSSIVWLKLDTTGLSNSLNDRLSDLLREIRLEDPTVRDVSIGDSSRLTQTHIGRIREASNLLMPDPSIRIVPADLLDSEAALIAAAASKHVRSRNFGVGRLNEIRMRFIPGGRTSAKITLLELDDGGAALVAKVGKAEYIRDEARRFQWFMAKWDRYLFPKVHIHGDIGAILFMLVSDELSPDLPAPTAEKLLDELSGAETWGNGAKLSESDLTEAMCGAVTKLAKLNLVPYTGVGFVNHAWISMDGVKAQLSKGIDWRVDDGSRAFNVVDLIDDCARICQQLDGKATVHGDTHLRNLLIRSKEAFFIDYAYSGPGHPCFDLARLSCAMLMRVLRMIDSEVELAALLEELFVQGRGYEELASKHQRWCSSALNRIAIKTSIQCRKAALSVLDCYRGNIVDYLAVVFAMAVQAFCIPDLQSGVARGILRAIAPSIRAKQQAA